MATPLSDLPYFHGTVDTRECRELLPDLGDFLVRNFVRELEPTGSPTSIHCLLTVAVTTDQASAKSKVIPEDYSFKETCTTRLRTYAILTSDNNVFHVQGCSEKFATVQSLCESLINSKQSLPNGGMLVKAVTRQPWQLLSKCIEYPNPEVLLGKGAYGKVIKARLVREGREPITVALKSSTEEGAHVFSDMYAEARAMRRLIHPNIIRIEGVVVEKLPILLAVEFIEGTSLLSALQKNKVSNQMRFPVVVGILYGLLYMHTNNYIHRDIAARNVMVSNDCRLVKIIDFGLAKHGLRFTLGATQKIPAKWLSPEVLKTWTFSTKSDTWAFGVCIWEIYHNGAEPAYTVRKVAPKAAAVPDKNTKTVTRRRKKISGGPTGAPAAPAASVKRNIGSENDGKHLKITENVEFLPPLFEPMFDRMFSLKTRDRIELAAMADEVEKKILPTLPKMIADEVRVHVEKRPPFDPKFRVQLMSVSDGSRVSTLRSAPTGKSNTATPKRSLVGMSDLSKIGAPNDNKADGKGTEKKEKVAEKQKTARRKAKK
ncbi:hypothetical protein GCK72_017061 [Caenorhabditis remanei]|uniref:non-specific protein-tyrosine kinase n=1 Tax=Caenorhabditis remanei TaxID=31234 RepID=A0A6A5G712_CAERE|nr:hypothetical protein GCK72_017061 [Caenorhabditis remanei]KAF1750511.1 hypothetical protein GCK72_017061 [Caenorhabditis remanei]